MGWLNARDEREDRIDGSADRLAYLVVSYGLLALVAYRGFVDHVTSWDLLGLVVIGGCVGLGFRLRQSAMSRRGIASLAVTVLVAIVVAGTLAIIRS